MLIANKQALIMIYILKWNQIKISNIALGSSFSRSYFHCCFVPIAEMERSQTALHCATVDYSSLIVFQLPACARLKKEVVVITSLIASDF